MGALGAVLLAAGSSERFGSENKLLANVCDSQLVSLVARTVVDSNIDEVVVVTGWDEARISAAFERLPVRLVHNANWRLGMGTSISVGIAALSEDLDGVFIVPGDMPLLSRSLLLRLASAFEKDRSHPIVFPATSTGEQRNPVLWPRRVFNQLTHLSGAKGAKSVLQAHAQECLAVLAEDTATLQDIDTEDDLKWIRHLLANK